MSCFAFVLNYRHSFFSLIAMCENSWLHVVVALLSMSSLLVLTPNFIAFGVLAGSSGTEDFIHATFAVVEGMAQHASVLAELRDPIVREMLPPLANLVPSSNGQLKTATS